ncbi:MAG: alpha/beta hydrolase, partial [Myxococcota bacterium]|nr:alpha/beta hydrolase [Myxococcota bacterium]
YWDYRGLNSDEVDISIERHACDLRRLLEKEDIRDAFLVGWSMGVQVALSLFQRDTSSIQGLILLNGAGGGAIREVLNRPNWFWIEPLCQRIALGGRFWQRLGPFLARSQRWKSPFTEFCVKMKWLGTELERSEFHALLCQWLDVDLRRISAQIVVLGNHSTDAFIHSIDVKALVVMGNRDPLVSNRLTRKLAQSLPNSTLRCLVGSSHFTLIEYPQTLYHLMERWMTVQRDVREKVSPDL